MKQIKLQMDGNAACATWDDFQDLQNSPAGFGENILEAVTNLAEADHTYILSATDGDFCLICGADIGSHEK